MGFNNIGDDGAKSLISVLGSGNDTVEDFG